MSETTDLSTIIDTLPLDKETGDIASQIIAEHDVEKVKDLTHLFNMCNAKKNVIRVMKLNGLLDKVSDEMLLRFEKRPGEFSNADLLSYLQVTQSAIDRANKSLDLVDTTPMITTAPSNVNVNVFELSRDSKENVADAVKAILSRIQSMEKIKDAIEVEASTDENYTEPTGGQLSDSN